MHSVRRLPASTIERRVGFLLVEFAFQRQKRIKRAPIPLDEILQFLKLRLEFDDIAGRFGVAGVLGFTTLNTRQIFIDESLDPTEHPEREGRLNFTIAHETGHVVLHRSIPSPHLLPEHDQRSLEWQADKFAAYLLMPRYLVLREWEMNLGYAGPLVITPEMENIGIDNCGSREALNAALTDIHAEDLARAFGSFSPGHAYTIARTRASALTIRFASSPYDT